MHHKERGSFEVTEEHATKKTARTICPRMPSDDPEKKLESGKNSTFIRDINLATFVSYSSLGLPLQFELQLQVNYTAIFCENWTKLE